MDELSEQEVQHLLQRPPLLTGSAPSFAGLRVLITGAAGSIGSRLAQRLAALPCASLCLTDQNETELVRLLDALAAPPKIVEAALLDLAAPSLLKRLLREFRPDLIVHAAAVKHLPFLESQPRAALRNNVRLTYELLANATELGVHRVILVSSDKAAQPQSVLGLSKRLNELLLPQFQGLATALRLANVLESRGNVLDRWRHPPPNRPQLAVAGRPVTRYFVSAREATDLLFSSAKDECRGRLLLPRLEAPTAIFDLFERAAQLWPQLAALPPKAYALQPGEAETECLARADEGPLQIIDEALHAIPICSRRSFSDRDAAQLLQVEETTDEALIRPHLQDLWRELEP